MKNNKADINIKGISLSSEEELELNKILCFILEVCPSASVKMIFLKNKTTEALFTCSLVSSAIGRFAVSFYESGISPTETLRKIDKRIKKELSARKKIETGVFLNRGEQRIRTFNLAV